MRLTSGGKLKINFLALTDDRAVFSSDTDPFWQYKIGLEDGVAKVYCFTKDGNLLGTGSPEETKALKFISNRVEVCGPDGNSIYRPSSSPSHANDNRLIGSDIREMF